MRRERRRVAYWITAAVSLAVGMMFIWPLSFDRVPKLLMILGLMLWMQITVWASVRRRRSRHSGSANSENYI